jgi:hypothetical protein
MAAFGRVERERRAIGKENFFHQNGLELVDHLRQWVKVARVSLNYKT